PQRGRLRRRLDADRSPRRRLVARPPRHRTGHRPRARGVARLRGLQGPDRVGRVFNCGLHRSVPSPSMTVDIPEEADIDASPSHGGCVPRADMEWLRSWSPNATVREAQRQWPVVSGDRVNRAWMGQCIKSQRASTMSRIHLVLWTVGAALLLTFTTTFRML